VKQIRNRDFGKHREKPHRLMRSSRALVLVTSTVLLVSCTPKVRYSLPPTVMLPVESAGIRDASKLFGATFCSVFEEFVSQKEDGCYRYLGGLQTKQSLPQPPHTSDIELQRYRYVLVNGFMSGCFRGSAFQVFGDADAHLGTHGVKLERVMLTGMDTPEADAEQIVNYLLSAASLTDSRPIVLVGYSKGATDLQAAILRIQRTSPVLESRIKAFVTVAGMIGGTRLYDQIGHPKDLAALLSHFQFFGCPPGKRDFSSLSRQQRQNFLSLHWRELALVPTYSLCTVSTHAETSRILWPVWDRLSVYSVDQDGQMAEPEELPPGAVYLGTARADHWAVGVPLEHDRELRLLANKNHYPRPALLEAILRFVVADLRKTSLEQ